MPQMPSSFRPIEPQQPTTFQPVVPEPAQAQMPSSFQPIIPDNVPQQNVPQGNPLVPPAPLEPAHTEVIPNVMTPAHNQEQNRGFLHSVFDAGRNFYQNSPVAPVWNTINTPLFTFGAEKPQVQSQLQGIQQEHPIAGTAFNFGVNTVNNLGTPLNIATAGTAGIAKATGVGAFNTITRMLSVPVGIEGTVNLLDPHATPGQRMAGALELWGAKQGLKSKITVDANKIPSIPFEHIPPQVMADDFIFSNYIRDIGKVKEGQPHRIVLDTISPTITNKLSELGYVPSGAVTEGPYAGRLFMVKASEIPKTPGAKTSWVREFINLPRGLTTTLDMSAPLRQGAPMIWYKAWWTSWDDMVKAWSSEKAYQLVQKSIDDHPLFHKVVEHDWRTSPITGEMEWLPKEKPSIAQKAGLAMTDLSNWTSREELIQSRWAEKFPGARRSNRAYTAFLNKLRADSFISMVKNQEGILGRELKDAEYKEIANFINTATGRGKIELSIPWMERNEAGKMRPTVKQLTAGPGLDKLASNVLFSPKLAASRVQLLNPFTYLDPKLSPYVRRQYLRAALNQASIWLAANGLGYAMGGQNSINPTNADFGKIRYGNLRIDPGAGFNQFIVDYFRMATGLTTSSSSGEVREYGQGYNPPTRYSAFGDFAGNKLHPLAKFVFDMARATTQPEQQVRVGDRILQMYAPLVMQDLADLWHDYNRPGGNKNLPPEMVAVMLSFFGMGSQVYGTHKEEPNYFLIPPESDAAWTGGMPPGMDFAISHILPKKYQENYRNRRTR